MFVSDSKIRDNIYVEQSKAGVQLSIHVFQIKNSKDTFMLMVLSIERVYLWEKEEQILLMEQTLCCITEEVSRFNWPPVLWIKDSQSKKPQLTLILNQWKVLVLSFLKEFFFSFSLLFFYHSTVTPQSLYFFCYTLAPFTLALLLSPSLLFSHFWSYTHKQTKISTKLRGLAEYMALFL